MLIPILLLLNTPIVHAVSNPNPVTAAATLSDGQVLDALITFDRAEIDFARGALLRSENPLVRDLAQAMLDRYSDNLIEAQRLANTARTQLTENSVSATLQVSANTTATALRRQPLSVYDRVYVDGLVDWHRSALDRIDEWSVATQDRAIAAFLANTRVATANLLTYAEDVRLKLEDERTSAQL